MKRPIPFLIGLTLGAVVIGCVWWRHEQNAGAARAAELARSMKERNQLEALLAAARNRPAPSPALPDTVSTVTPSSAARRTPAEILTELRAIRIRRSGVARSRQALRLFEELVEAGPPALPAIHGFLARYEDVDYELDASASSDPAGKAAPKAKGKDKAGKDAAALLPTEFIVPPSLRFGLFDVVRRIGGEQAEQILAEMLNGTGRGAEVYYFARVLEQMAPGKYREAAVATARDFLLNPLPASARGPLDQNDRSYLYAVLTFFNDSSLVALAQTQLIQPDGTLDGRALRFLGDTLKADSLPVLAKAMFDSKVGEGKEREDLFKEALSYTGADPRADELLVRAVTQEDLPLKLREKSLRDLDKHGFENPEHLTERDLRIIQARLQLLDTLVPELREPKLQEAWGKAHTELTAYLEDPTRKSKKK